MMPPLNKSVHICSKILKVGSDGARHAWYKWLSGQQPEGTSMTHGISLYDCTLLRVESLCGTPDFNWKEQKPNSDRITRVLGKFC